MGFGRKGTKRYSVTKRKSHFSESKTETKNRKNSELHKVKTIMYFVVEYFFMGHTKSDH